MFGNLFKKKEKVSEAEQTIVQKVNLRKEKVAVELRKKNITSKKARIVFVLDHSGSFRWAYNDGTIQNITERLFPMAMQMDDNGEMEMFLFDDGYKEFSPVTISNLDEYVNNYLIKQGGHYGGTNYEPVITQITKRYGKKDKSTIPTFVIFITDGNNADKRASEKAIQEASKYNIFWKFVGAGQASFSFLEKLDNIGGRVVDNANFIKINDLNAITDEELYSRLLEEYNDWLNACRTKNIVVD